SATRWRCRSESDRCPPTWASSWTATGGGPRRRGWRAWRAIGRGATAAARGWAGRGRRREGSKSVREVTRTARRIGVQALTLYAFSAQNWSRPVDEVAGLMDLLREDLQADGQGD